MNGSLVLWSTTPTPAPEHILQRLLQQKLIADGRLRLVVLQTPLDQPRAEEVTLFRDQFSVSGVSAETLDPGLQHREDAFRPKVITAIRNAHIVIGTGGSPERMMSVIQDTPALSAIREVFDRGGCVGGGSAGAMVFGTGVPGRSGEPMPFLNWVPFVIAPHFGTYRLDKWKAAFPGQTILGLPDTSVAIVEDGAILSVGHAPLVIIDTHTDTAMELTAGERLPMTMPVLGDQ